MKKPIRLAAALLVLLLASCSVIRPAEGESELLPEEEKVPMAQPAPSLPSEGMEPDEAAEAFVQAGLRSAYLNENDGFTPYTAGPMAEYDPDWPAVMSGVDTTYGALAGNARYWQEKARWFRYMREEQGIRRENFESPCISSVTAEGDGWADVTVSGMMSWTYADSGEGSGMEFTFEVKMIRTDHRTAYAWVMGDAVEPLDAFDAEHKGDPDFTADELIKAYESGNQGLPEFTGP